MVDWAGESAQRTFPLRHESYAGRLIYPWGLRRVELHSCLIGERVCSSPKIPLLGWVNVEQLNTCIITVLIVGPIARYIERCFAIFFSLLLSLLAGRKVTLLGRAWLCIH